MTLNSSKRGPSGYTRVTSTPSLIDAAAKRATAVTTRKKSPREKSELSTWEGEGGAATPPAQAPKASQKPLTMKPGMTAIATGRDAGAAGKNKRS